MDIFLNGTVLYRILLATPVTLASSEVIFKSKTDEELLLEIHVSGKCVVADYTFHRT